MWDICLMAWRIGEILDLGDQLDWILRMGFEGMGFHASAGRPGQWRGIDPADADDQARARLREKVAQFSLCEIHAPFKSELVAGSLLGTTEELLPILDFAGNVRASIVTVHASPPETDSGADCGPWHEALERLNARALKNRLLVGLELTYGFEWLARMGLSNIGVTLDVGHMYLDDGKWLEPYGTLGNVVRLLDGILVHLHLHDYDGTHDHIELGTARVDFDGLLMALAEIGYEGGLCLELNPDRVSPEGMLRSKAWLRKRMRALGVG